jgi:hypothetical protein
VTDPTVYVVELGATDFSAPARKRGLSWTGSLTPVDVSPPCGRTGGAVTADRAGIVDLDGTDRGRSDPAFG